MKKITTSIFTILVTLSAFAQLPLSGGPDNFGYTFKNSNHSTGPSYNWFDITTIGTPVTGLADDNFVGPFPISGFSYYTNSPSNFWIGSNGFVSFVPANIASQGGSFTAIPSTGGTHNFIAPFLTDLTLSGATNPGQVYRYDSGDTICISFISVPFWVNNANQYGGENTFQVILNRADSSITYNYQKQTGVPDAAYVNDYISIGIENATGADGLQYYRGATTPIGLTSVKFEYPAIVQPITDIEVNWLNNEASAGKFISSGSSFTPTANIKNVGNQDVTGSININYIIENSSQALIGIGSATLSSLVTGKDTTMVLGSPITINSAERYRFYAYVNGVANDFVQANDTNSMLIVSVDTILTPHLLDYSDGIATGSIGWNGGNGGTAIYIEPPYYPAKIVSTNFYIAAQGTPAVGFHSVIYDNSGRQGAYGVVLDSAFIPNTAVTTLAYNTHMVPGNVVINSGGVYLQWYMGGDGINLGSITTNNASRRTFEVLGGAWSDYRSGSTDDFLMGIGIEPLATSIAKEDIPQKFSVYPTPASESVWVETDKKMDLNAIRIFNIEGKEVSMKVLQYDGKIKIFKGNVSNGTYFLNYGNKSTKLIFTN